MNDPLSRRERQIMDIVYRLGRAAVADVQAELLDPPSYSTVRALMGTLVDKGHLMRTRDGKRYLYAPTVPADRARVSALRAVVATFFAGSPLKAALALVAEAELAPDERSALERVIERARKDGR